MNIKDEKTRVQILKCLLEGVSIRATSRIVDVSKTTVLKLLCDSGEACLAYQRAKLRNLSCQYIQVDELWSFVYSKKKNTKNVPGKGALWTWTSICADTKLVPCWYVGDRTSRSASIFIKDLAARIVGKVQITSDGFKAYEGAIKAYMRDADYAMYVKHYVKNRATGSNLIIFKNPLQGNPDIRKISTSFIERQNLNIRMGIRRFTRKTNAFSKSLENHTHALALYFYYYNFVRKHKTLSTTPANFMGISGERSLVDILSLTRHYESIKKSG